MTPKGIIPTWDIPTCSKSQRESQQENMHSACMNKDVGKGGVGMHSENHNSCKGKCVDKIHCQLFSSSFPQRNISISNNYHGHLHVTELM